MDVGAFSFDFCTQRNMVEVAKVAYIYVGGPKLVRAKLLCMVFGSSFGNKVGTSRRKIQAEVKFLES